jgi:bacterioferritin-associated ferredoxin
MSEIICHCFGHTDADIREDARKHGRSTIAETIAAAKRFGQCRCAEKNPTGT